MKYTTISSKRQITLGSMVMDALNLQPYDKVYIEVDNDKAILYPLKGDVIDELAGSINVPQNKRGKTVEELNTFMKRHFAKHIAKK